MEGDYETLSASQYKLLSILPIPTAILSVVGSTAIIFMVVRSGRRREWTPYKRLLLGMSVCDIILSINAAIGNFMRPEATSPRTWAVGNSATCTASGFLGQLALSAILYNGMLSFYFLLSARFGWKNRQFSPCLEPLMHVFCIGFPLVTASIGVGLGVFSEPVMGLGCQVNDYPRNCGEGPGKTGETCLSITIAWIFMGLPRILNGLAIVLNNLVICVYVWRQARPKKPRISKHNSAKSAGNTSSDESSSQYNAQQAEPSQTKGSIIASDLYKDSVDVEKSRSVRFLPKKLRSLRESFEKDHISINGEISSSRRPSASQKHNAALCKKMAGTEEDQLRRLQLVRSQAILFVGSYFVSNIWVGLTSLLESISPTDADEYAMAALCFPLLVLYAIFVPLQGFFNMLVYMRPKYAKYRTHFPEESRLWAFWLTLTGEDSLHLRKNKEDTLDPYSPQNNAKTGKETPFPPIHRERTPSKNPNLCQHESPSRRSPKYHPSSPPPVHSESIWTKEEFIPTKEFEKKPNRLSEENAGDLPTMWEPIQKARRYFSSLKGSSLGVISELSEMSFEVVKEDDRWDASPKISTSSPMPLVVPERFKSVVEPENLVESHEEVQYSLPRPPSKRLIDSPISCPKRKLSPPPAPPLFS